MRVAFIGLASLLSVSAAISGSLDVVDVREGQYAGGAKCDGVTNDTAAFSAAISYATSHTEATIVVPAGTCLINLTAAIGDAQLVGQSSRSVLSPYAEGNVLELTTGNFPRIRNISFQPKSFATGSGLVIDSAVGNLLLEDVKFGPFPTYLINCNGSVGSQISGLQIRGSSYFLAGSSTQASLIGTYCNDFTIDGAQFGVTGASLTGGPGISLDHSSAGHLINNKIWQNQIGVNITNSNYLFIINNRITQSGQSGAVINTAQFLSHEGNQYYSNSQSSLGAYEDLSLTNVQLSTFFGDKFYNWSGANSASYNITADANSNTLEIVGEHFRNYATAPVNILGQSQINLCDNLPKATALTNTCNIGTALFQTPAAGVGGSTSTIYLSGISGTSESAQRLGLTGATNCLSASSTATPAVGEIWTYTLRKTGADTALSATQASGAYSVSLCSASGAVSFGTSDSFSVKVTSSNGATNLGAVGLRGSLSFTQ